MRALTLWQPWASLVIGGFKSYETWTWHPACRGPLAIHAAKSEPKWVQNLMNRQLNEENRIFWECLAEMGYEAFPQLPRGKVLGYVEFKAIFRTEDIRDRVGKLDLAFGLWSDGRFAWQLDNIIRFDKPIRARGHQGLWEWRKDDE